MKQIQMQSDWGLPVSLGHFYPPRAILAFKHWCLQQVTVPSNFKKILQVTNEGKDDGKMGEVRVICVGLSRTGTSSLKAALSILLPGLTYHGMDFLNEVNSRESHEFWTAMRDGTASKEMIVKYFRARRCAAVCDVPAILHWEKIHEAFPDAKIIITQRDPGAWHKSINTTLVPLATMVNRWSWLLQIMCVVLYQRTSQIELLKILLDQFTREELLEEDSARKFYDTWNQEIEQKCNNNVLLFNVADGWGPLCDYLDCSVPKQKFPRLNDSAALVRHRKYLAFLIFLSFVAMFSLVFLLLWAFS
jgi:hypothetical protein